MKLLANALIAGSVFVAATLVGCGNNSDSSDAEGETATPTVEVASMSIGPIVETVDVTASSVYQVQSVIKAPVTGFVTQVLVASGSKVSTGELLFTVQTKESKVLGNVLDSVNKGMQLSGIWKIKADASGFVAEVSHQKGDYVPEGEPLLTVVQQNSLAFVLNLPFEWSRLVRSGMPIALALSDGSVVQGRALNPLPLANQGAQTIPWLLAVEGSRFIPNGIQAVAKIPNYKASQVQLLPKAAVLANETQTNFWVMRLIDSTTAVKMVVHVGHQSEDAVEILQPKLNPNDKFLISGNYGVSDTLKVNVSSGKNE